MKQVARFIGKVTKLNQPPEESYALLKEDKPGAPTKETTADSKLFLDNNIKDGAEFEILIFESDDGKHTSTVRPISGQFEFPF